MISNWRRVELSPVAFLPGNLLLYQNIIYHGSPTHPEIGDVRVWFEMTGRTEPGHQDKVKLLLNNRIYVSFSLSLSLSLSLSPSLQISIVAKQLPGGVLTTFPSHIHPGYNILYVYMEQLTMDVGCSVIVPFPFTHSHTDMIRRCS